MLSASDLEGWALIGRRPEGPVEAGPVDSSQQWSDCGTLRAEAGLPSVSYLATSQVGEKP